MVRRPGQTHCIFLKSFIPQRLALSLLHGCVDSQGITTEMLPIYIIIDQRFSTHPYFITVSHLVFSIPSYAALFQYLYMGKTKHLAVRNSGERLNAYPVLCDPYTSLSSNDMYGFASRRERLIPFALAVLSLRPSFVMFLLRLSSVVL
jgi:hypothetical protein